MQIRFDEISPQGSRYEIKGGEILADQQDFVVRAPSLEAQCALSRKGDAKVGLAGRLQVALSLVCDRCLGRYDVDLESEFQVLFEVESAESWRVKDLDAKIADLDSEMLEEPVIDLDDVVRQQVYLALPMKNLCSEACKGVCSQCGTNLNVAACDCIEERKALPFAALARLKK